jgi:TniQ protein
MSTPLPRSLAPLPDESLPGYLLRLAHRLDLAPANLAAVTGLAPTRSGTIPAGRMLALAPDMARAFARTCNLTVGEAHALTLETLADRYPPLDLRFCGRQRVTHGLFVKENWILSRSTRYCPDCLTGDGSLIQQRHGGAWNKLWRLPVVFACPIHRRLLRHACPVCRDPVHHRAHGAQLLPSPSDASVHPTACRNPVTTASPGRPPPCGHRLDRPTRGSTTGTNLEQLLHLQQRLLDMLHPNGPTSTRSVGIPTVPARFLVDLRILSCLIAASWPAARHLVTDPAHKDLLNRHVADTRREIDTVRRTGRAVRELALYDRPPLRADTCAVLLALADNLAADADPDTVGLRLRPIVAAVPFARLWTRQFLAGDGYCSPGLQTALGREVGNAHVIKRAGPPPRPVQPPSRPAPFDVQHVPAHALPEWREQYFADFADVTPHLLGRAISVRLAQIATDSPATDAGTLLGLPRSAAHYAVTDVSRQLGARRRRALDNAIDALADSLHTANRRLDYGRRRDTLGAWTITPDQWHELIDGLPEQPVQGHVWRHTDWGDNKRTLAAVWIWVHTTRGEHIYATPVRPDPQKARPGGYHARYVHTRWRFIRDAKPGHYAALRARLDILAEQLINQIDAS